MIGNTLQMKKKPMDDIVYDYVIVDTKLIAMNQFHRHKPAYSFLSILVNALNYNHIKFKEIVWAYDLEKSSYRQTLQPSYKAHRKIVASRQTVAEQNRKKDFDVVYQKLPKVLKYLGKSGQDYGSGIEADDVPSMVRALRPDSNILKVSLDEDWSYDIDTPEDGSGVTHLLKYTTNEIFKTQEDVIDHYELCGNDLMDYSCIAGQAKDGVYGLKNFGKSRFIKYLLPYPKEQWFNIIEEFIEKKKWNMHVHPNAMYNTAFQNYHHNLLIMQPIPMDKHEAKNIKFLESELSRDTYDITYEKLIVDSVELFDDILPISSDDFNLLRNGNF